MLDVVRRVGSGVVDLKKTGETTRRGMNIQVDVALAQLDLSCRGQYNSFRREGERWLVCRAETAVCV